MQDSRVHTFHIPVLGLAFSIDTPIRVSRFGISSVMSIVDDILIEQMRKHYSKTYNEPYVPISNKEEDYRAKRITAYLNLVQRIVHNQIETLKASAFETRSEIVKYFEMLADHSPLKKMYQRMMHTTDVDLQKQLQSELREHIVPGFIDVNIMTKVDKLNIGPDRKDLGPEFSDASASLRGFMMSELNSSVVFSAGMNPRLFSYLGKSSHYFYNGVGGLKKQIILKVSDYRSAIIQGKYLAKKGLWISEYRIESGLNCGGHAFATDGYLLGPILEEFKQNKESLIADLHQIFSSAVQEKGFAVPENHFSVRITVQGGIGTAKEDEFLRTHYEVDGTGWGSPFLLVPEATNVDEPTRNQLAAAKRKDFYLSSASPLGIPFNNLRGTTSELLIKKRYEEGKPGSPCEKKFLVSNTEFTEKPICMASKQYQALKLKQIHNLNLPQEELDKKITRVIEKSCLCEDLAAPGYINSAETEEEKAIAVAVCPGPNLAYFSKMATLEEMIGHIYGRLQLMTDPNRSNMFINELQLYIDYLKNEIDACIDITNAMKQKYFVTFKTNLLEGIEYYKSLIPKLVEEAEQYREKMLNELQELEEELLGVNIPTLELV